MPTTIQETRALGQSIWLDAIDRSMLRSGLLKDLVVEKGVSGLTSNPAILEEAMSKGDDYDQDLHKLSREGLLPEDLFYALAVKDIQDAADLLRPLYDDSKRDDGYVSLEVSPRLANMTKETKAQVLRFWQQVSRPNVMIKIPGTTEGIPAIRGSIRRGININITLLFSLERYRAVVDAYMLGLEDRLLDGQPIDTIRSVASFFLSRIDTVVDPIVVDKGHKEWKGEVAIACAKEAYEIYKELFGSARFAALRNKGAHVQRLLWASTSAKDPAYQDLKYADALIGPDTIDTLPMATLQAFLDHGHPRLTLEEDTDRSLNVLNGLKEADIDLEALAERLEAEGIQKFNEPFDKVLLIIEKKMHI